MDAARRMSELDVGALPVCGPDDRLHGATASSCAAIRAR
ncbi:Hypoxic response protein 1 [Streptomyces sp. ADI95-16]|nr:Hypoxic response protein 1 [Streptomyces sp. ADI95-16]